MCQKQINMKLWNMTFLKTKTQIHYFDYQGTNIIVTTKKVYTSQRLMIYMTYKMNTQVMTVLDF